MNPATDRAIVLRYVESLPDGSAFDLSDDDPPVLTVTDRTPHARIGAAIMHLAEGNDQL